MSILFSDYKKEHPSKAGYLRIGHVVLSTPPVDIQTNRVVNNERMTVLRGRNDMVKKTGQSRWDVTVRWIAMLDSTAADDAGRYQQWEDLRTILAIFKAAPFVEVENGFIRQIISDADSSMSSARTAFALRQLRISTHNDIVDALDISLTMTLFNYYPYSTDFGYLGDSGQSSDAWQSSAFQDYITKWKQQNIDASPTDGSSLLNWKDQTTGTVALKWREYTIVRTGTAVSTDLTPAAIAALQADISQTPTASGGSKTKAGVSGSGQYDSLITSYASKYNISAAMIKAVMGHESNFKATAVGANFKGHTTNAGSSINQVTSNLQSHIQTDADGGTAYVNAYTAQNGTPPDLGLMQINWATAKTLNSSLRPIDLFKPDTNIGLGAQYLNTLYSKGMTDQSVYWYNTGPDPKGKRNNSTEQAYTADVLKRLAQYATGNLDAATVSSSTSTPAPPSTSAITASAANGGQAPGDNLTDDQKQEVMNLIEDGWSFDHAVNDMSFFYREKQISLNDNEHGATVNPYGLFPTQFSILFVNNIAQIPLAGYQYPTYQHIGSASSKMSIVLMSKGDSSADGEEPIHLGVSTLTAASEFLEAQYLRFRTSWRRVSSVHRMQAFFVENQLLNMLGIRGLLIDGINTTSLPNMSDTMQVELAASQYENIFEVSSSYKINTLDQSSAKTVQSLISTNAIGTMTKDEKNTISELAAFQDGRTQAQTNAESALATLVPYLLKIAANATDWSSFAGTGAVRTMGPSQVSIVSSPFLNGANNASKYKLIAASIASATTQRSFTPGQLAMVMALASSNTSSVVDFLLGSGSSVDSTVGQAFNMANGLIINTTDPQQAKTDVTALYDAALPMLMSFDSNFAADVNTLSNSPKFSSQFSANAPNPSGPGSSNDNQGHGAYRDLGLLQTSLNGNDFNPGYYFVDHNAKYQAQVRNNLDQVVNTTTQAANQANQQSRPGSYDIAITESTFVGSNSNTNSLVRMTNVPGYRMAEAFPTFKLFLMEDAAPGIVQAFDNFYSYASVLDIEVIRYKDRPDLARIEITNIANILQHKLFDNSMQGKYEQELYKREFFSITPTDSSGQVTGGDPNAGIVTGKTAANQVYQENLKGYDLRDGVVPGKVERVPLQYAALQPGTKIQVRMGYANNPDLLVPVFTGHVTSIEGDEVLMIEAESYLAELLDIPTQDDKPVAGKKYGGWQPWHDSGDAHSIVEQMLKMDNAKHFGGFKLSATPDPLMTGITWERRVGQIIGDFSLSPTNELTRIGAALASSYDRSPENILINHVINHLGDAAKQRLTRDFTDESTGFLDLYYSFSYKIPDNSTKSIWDIIRDICRRYPEYLVMAKQYGFPYSADATLLVAHPLDWYFARLPMAGDDERFRSSLSLNTEFTTWWQAQGSTAWSSMLQQIKTDQALFAQLSVPTPTNPKEFYATLSNLDRAVGQFFGSSLNNAAAQTSGSALWNFIQDADQLLGAVANHIEDPSVLSGQKAARAEIAEVRSLWERYVETQNPSSDDRLKPVRRFHFIDHQSIVHNGMRLNDKIYNAIRIGSTTTKVNGAIPSHFTRVLDVTDLLINSKDNVEPYSHIVNSVSQSFMKEEVGKMYEGEIVLRGIPEIEPGDCLNLLDASTAIVGTVEVEKVIHSFNQETGYTSIVYPRCMTSVNEVVGANMNRMFSMVMAKSVDNILSLAHSIHHSSTSGQVALATGVGAVGITGAAGVALLGTPPGWVLDTLIGIAIVGGTIYATNQSEKQNMIEVMPVTRWARPWIGGLEGYQIADFFQNIENSFQAFKADNIYPLVDTYRYFKGAPNNALPVQTSSGQ